MLDGQPRNQGSDDLAAGGKAWHNLAFKPYYPLLLHQLYMPSLDWNLSGSIETSREGCLDSYLVYWRL